MAHRHKHDEWIDDLDARQRNVVFPYTLRNSRRVDSFLWNGSPNATRVQRIGACLIGLFGIGTGLLGFAATAKSKAEGDYKFAFLCAVVGILFIAVGVRIARNGLKRHHKP